VFGRRPSRWALAHILVVIVDLYINTECPLDGVSGAVTSSYIGLAEYPVAQRGDRGYSASWFTTATI